MALEPPLVGINPLRVATSIIAAISPAKVAFIAAILSGRIDVEDCAPSPDYGDHSRDADDRLPSTVQMVASKTLLPLSSCSKRTPG